MIPRSTNGLRTAPASIKSTGRPRSRRRVSEAEELFERLPSSFRREFHEKVDIARIWVEVRRARSRAENLETRDVEASAERDQVVVFACDFDAHRGMMPVREQFRHRIGGPDSADLSSAYSTPQRRQSEPRSYRGSPVGEMRSHRWTSRLYGTRMAEEPSRGVMMDIGHWLRGLGLAQYEGVFRDNEII